MGSKHGAWEEGGRRDARNRSSFVEADIKRQQQESFFERAARRIATPKPEDLEPGGGFGPGGYGSYGSESEGAWGNENPGLGRSPAEAGPEHAGQPEGWQREVLTAGEIMTSGLRCAGPETALEELARIMRDERCGIVPIIDPRHRLIGVVTDRDLVVRGAATGKSFATAQAREVMTDEVEAVTPDEPLHQVLELMARAQIRRVPVVDREDRLLGLISLGDVATRTDADADLDEALERISADHPHH